MAAFNVALGSCSTEPPVFYEDEVDIHLNPGIGADWQLRGQQKRVVTPGRMKSSVMQVRWQKANPKF